MPGVSMQSGRGGTTLWRVVLGGGVFRVDDNSLNITPSAHAYLGAILSPWWW